MHNTLQFMMGNGCVQKDLKYENDYTKKEEAIEKEIQLDSEEFKKTLNDPDELMYQLNKANWAYHIESFDGVYKSIIQDLDCLRISYR